MLKNILLFYYDYLEKKYLSVGVLKTTIDLEVLRNSLIETIDIDKSLEYVSSLDENATYVEFKDNIGVDDVIQKFNIHVLYFLNKNKIIINKKES